MSLFSKIKEWSAEHTAKFLENVATVIDRSVDPNNFPSQKETPPQLLDREEQSEPTCDVETYKGTHRRISR